MEVAGLPGIYTVVNGIVQRGSKRVMQPGWSHWQCVTSERWCQERSKSGTASCGNRTVVVVNEKQVVKDWRSNQSRTLGSTDWPSVSEPPLTQGSSPVGFMTERKCPRQQQTTWLSAGAPVVGCEIVCWAEPAVVIGLSWLVKAGERTERRVFTEWQAVGNPQFK